MASMHFTQRAVDALKTDKAQADFLDSSVRLRGITFGVRVTQNARKEFFCRYSDHHGGKKSKRRLSLGDASQISLRAAHEKFRDIAARLDREREAASLEKSDLATPALTFKELCEEYLRLHASRKKDGGKDDNRMIAKTLLPRWRDLKASEIRKRDVAKLLDEIGVVQKKPVAANRTRALVSMIFSFGLQRELVDATPCVGLPEKFEEKSRERELSDEEIVSFWRATAKEIPVIRDMFRLLLLLGQRSGETKDMKWSDIHNGVWHIPSASTKNGKAQVVPLPHYITSLIEAHRTCGFASVFVVKGQRAVVNIQKAKRRIERRMLGVPSWTAHDLRRTCASGMERLNIPSVVVASVLNHSKSSSQGITAVYARHQYFKEKKIALERWCEYVLQLVGGGELACTLVESPPAT